MNYPNCPICLENIIHDSHILEPCNHKFHNECIIKSLRINGPRCPLCRGFNTSFNNNSSYYENTITTPITHDNITYDNIIYDIAGNNITDYTYSFTYTNGFTDATMSTTTTISYDVISIQ